MPSNTIIIDLDNELTQAEFCRRTGETLANLSPKLKKMSVRDIPELGLKLINISAPSFDTIRIEAPAVREYTIGELSSLFGNLLAQYQTNEQTKDARIASLERMIEDMSSKLESMGEEVEQQKQFNDLLQVASQEKEELVKGKEAHIEELISEQQQEIARILQEKGRIIKETEQRVEVANADLKVAQNLLNQSEKNLQEQKAVNQGLTQQKDSLLMENNTLKTENEKRVSELGQANERIVSDLKLASFSLEEKEKAYQELKMDYIKVQEEREMLQSRLLDIGNQIVGTRITEELQSFRDEFLSVFKSFQNGNMILGTTASGTTNPVAKPGKAKTKGNKGSGSDEPNKLK